MMKQSVVALFTNIRNAHTYLNYRATKVWMPHEREARYVSQTVPRQKWTALLEISEQTRKIVSQYMLSKKLTSARSCFSITITMRRTRKHTSTPRKPSRAEKRHQEKKVRAIVPIEMMKMYLRRVWNKRIKYVINNQMSYQEMQYESPVAMLTQPTSGYRIYPTYILVFLRFTSRGLVEHFSQLEVWLFSTQPNVYFDFVTRSEQSQKRNESRWALKLNKFFYIVQCKWIGESKSGSDKNCKKNENFHRQSFQVS